MLVEVVDEELVRDGSWLLLTDDEVDMEDGYGFWFFGVCLIESERGEMWVNADGKEVINKFFALGNNGDREIFLVKFSKEEFHSLLLSSC